MKKTTVLAVFTLLIALLTLSSAQNAELQGYVKDRKTGAPYAGINVDIYPSDDHSRPAAQTQTDSKGYYSATVPPGKYYDVYARIGDTNPTYRTSAAVAEGGVYIMDFNIDAESSYTNIVVEKYGFWIVVLVAFIILAVILADTAVRMLSRRREGSMEAGVQARAGEKPADELGGLLKDKQEIESMIELSKSKYHKRLIDDESFREIVRDQQKNLIEVEAKIRSLKGEKTD